MRCEQCDLDPCECEDWILKNDYYEPRKGFYYDVPNDYQSSDCRRIHSSELIVDKYE